MNANPVLLQKKYSRVIGRFAKQQGLSLDAALDKNHITILSKFYISFSLCIC